MSISETIEINLGHSPNCFSGGTFCSCSFEQDMFHFPGVRESWENPFDFLVDQCDCGMGVNEDNDSSTKRDKKDREMTKTLSEMSAKVKNDPYSLFMKKLIETKKKDPTLEQDLNSSIVELDKNIKSEFKKEVCEHFMSTFCMHCSFKIFVGVTGGMVKYDSDEQRNQRARLWLTVSARSGNPFAQYLMGIYHYHLGAYPLNFCKELKLATGPFSLTAKNKDFDFNKCSTNIQRECVLKEMQKVMFEHLEQALIWFEKAAAQGHLFSSLYLIHMFFRNSLRHSLNIVDKWVHFTELLDPQNPIFLYFKGVMHLLGKGGKTPLDKSKALECFIRSSKAGCGASVHEIYRLTKDESTDLIRKLSVIDGGSSSSNPGDKVRVENILKMQEQISREWLKKGVELNYCRSLHEMGHFLTVGGLNYKKDVKSALTYYIKAVEQGHPLSMSVLGSFLLEGQSVVKNEHRAFELFLMAALNGLPLARVQVAMMFKMGLHVEKDLQKAIWWLSWAAVDGFGIALVEMGRIYYELLDDWKKGFLCFEKAATSFNIASGYFFMGQMLLYGRKGVVDKDVKKAKTFWLKAKELGFNITQTEWKLLEKGQKAEKLQQNKEHQQQQVKENQEKEKVKQVARNTKKKSSKKKKAVVVKKDETKKKDELSLEKKGWGFLSMPDDNIVIYDSETRNLMTPKTVDDEKISLCYLCGHYRNCFEKGGTKLHFLQVCSKCTSIDVVVCETKANANVRVDPDGDFKMVQTYFLFASNYSSEARWLYGKMDEVGDFCLVNASLFETEKTLNEQGKTIPVCNVKVNKQAFTAYPVFLDILSTKTNYSHLSLLLRMVIVQEMFMKYESIRKHDYSKSTLVFTAAGELTCRNFCSSKTHPPFSTISEAMSLILPERKRDDLFLHLIIQLEKGVEPIILVRNHPFFCRSDESLLLYMETSLKIETKLKQKKHKFWREWVKSDANDDTLLKKVEESSDSIYDMVNFCRSLRDETPKKFVRNILRFIPDFFVYLYFCFLSHEKGKAMEKVNRNMLIEEDKNAVLVESILNSIKENAISVKDQSTLVKDHQTLVKDTDTFNRNDKKMEVSQVE